MVKLLKFLSKISICFFAVLFALVCFPSFSRAVGPSTGLITISIRDDEGQAVGGNWYLYYGVGRKDLLARSGSRSESFMAAEGPYFLEVRGPVNSRPYYFRYSKTPQYLAAGSSIFFNIKYYGSQEDMLVASQEASVRRTLETTSVGLPTDDVYDTHGCNLTRGYAWCAQSQTCTKNWSPDCQITAFSPGASGAEFIGFVPLVSAIKTAPMAQNVGGVKYGRHLFATGASTVLLLISSSFPALGIVRLFGRRRRLPLSR